MVCHKCGSMVAVNARACGQCGVAIDHHSNAENFWSRESGGRGTPSPMRLVRHVRSQRWLVWLVLFIPAVWLPYVFFITAKHYNRLDTALVDGAVALIILSIMLLIKKYFKYPK